MSLNLQARIMIILFLMCLSDFKFSTGRKELGDNKFSLSGLSSIYPFKNLSIPSIELRTVPVAHAP